MEAGASAPIIVSLSKGQYVDMMKKMYRVLIEDYDEADAAACAEEDWEKDSGGAGVLTREAFGDCLFEVRVLGP